MGVWGGPDNVSNTGDEAEIEIYYFDGDDDGLGSGDPYELCNGLNLTGWATNNDDDDDNCFFNIHDCADVCDGPSVVDVCGECGGDGIPAG